MAASARNLDDFNQLLQTSDTKSKLTVANNLLAYLADPENSLECEDIGQLIDAMVPWMQSSNSKVSQNSIDILTNLVERMAMDFRPYVQIILSPVIDRLGDNKEMVREKAQLLLLKLMEREVISPQFLFEKLGPAFSHKNAKIREEVLLCLQAALREQGAQSVGVSRHVGTILKLLHDPAPSVRDTAFNTLLEIYRHVGEKLKHDIQKRANTKDARISSLISRFDDLKIEGDVLPSAYSGTDDSIKGDDEPDATSGAIPKSKPRIQSVTKKTPCSSKSSSASAAGAVDEAAFLSSFEDVPTVQIFSVRELEDQLTKISETINDPNKDWSKRVDALKKIRSLILAGAPKYEEFFKHVKLLEQPFQTTVKDLRSQVVREACCTIAFMSVHLKSKLDHFAEVILDSLINQIPNSAKVMASAALVTIRFILRNTHWQRLIPLITSNMGSKSKEIRRACCEFLDLILQEWSTHHLERQISNLQEAVRKGIGDADAEARQYARKAYWNFKRHFPDKAEQLLNSLDPAHKKALQGDLGMSNSSSTNSLNQQGTINRLSTRARSAADGPRRGTAPTLSTVRSNSAIDLQAAQRAKVRAQYAAMARHNVGSGASLPRTKKPADPGVMSTSAVTSPERLGRTRSRMSNVSQSQPTSRSGSPSSRLSYATFSSNRESVTDGRQRRPSGIPLSTGPSREASRETSPSRYSSSLLDRSFGSKLRGRPVHSTSNSDRPLSSRPVLAQKILQQSREAESALADALNFDPVDNNEFSNRVPLSRKSYRSLDEHSDDSETSSVCSERSFDSYRRSSDSGWAAVQQRLESDWDPRRSNISEIISNCASTHWNERKDGLVSLQLYLQNGNQLYVPELKKLTEIFTKLFVDNHTKVFSMFLDALNELIQAHKDDLHDWLYILLTRLMNKLGGDLLGSIQNKIHKCLLIIRDSFPLELQMNVVIRFLVDQTQTPNTKVKIAVLQYLAQLASVMEAQAFNPGSREAAAAFAKIIMWTNDQKSSELRKAAQNALIALFNLNTPQVTMILSSLSSEYQETAASVVNTHLRRSSTGSSPPSPSSYAHSPGTPQCSSRPSLEMDEGSLNPEEVYRSLHRTTAEIQNYSFDGGLSSVKLLDRDREATSHDSGISQMSTGGEKIEDPMEHLLAVTREPMGILTQLDQDLGEPNDDTSSTGYVAEDIQIINSCIEILKGDDESQLQVSEQECRKALTQVRHLIKSGKVSVVVNNFKTLLRVLVSQLTTSSSSIKTSILGVLHEMFKDVTVRLCFTNYLELIVLRILTAYKDPCKEVVKAAELCASAAGKYLPPENLIVVVCPLIKTGELPINLGAIKILTRVVENGNREVLDPYVPEIMESLIKAYDSVESSVRKSAVFCMVALHSLMGEEALQPHLSQLSKSKLKLLHLYIRRSLQGGSTSGSGATMTPKAS